MQSAVCLSPQKSGSGSPSELLVASCSFPNSRHLTSHFLCLFTTSVSTTYLTEVWSTELNQEVSDDIWNEGLTIIQTCSIDLSPSPHPQRQLSNHSLAIATKADKLSISLHVDTVCINRRATLGFSWVWTVFSLASQKHETQERTCGTWIKPFLHLL